MAGVDHVMEGYVEMSGRRPEEGPASAPKTHVAHQSSRRSE